MGFRIQFGGLTLLTSLGWCGAVQAAPPVGYYDSVDASTAETLRATLHAVIDGHTQLPYTASGTDTWDVLELADQAPFGSSNILDIYRNRTFPKQGGGGGGYDREHVWPKNHGVGYNQSEPQHTDCHGLYLSDDGYNGSRSDIPFGVCTSGCTTLATDLNNGQGGPGDPNLYTTAGLGRFQPWSERRGDVARAILYLDVRYEGDGGEVDLVATDNEALIAQAMDESADGQPTPAVGYTGLLSVLLQWHASDPVDQRDRDRNDVVFSFQGNRNPFIDHPEWVEELLGASQCSVAADCDDGEYCNGQESCSGGTCVPGERPCTVGSCNELAQSCDIGQIEAFINELHYDNAGEDVGEFVEIAGPAGLDLGGYSLVAYNGASTVWEPYAALPLEGVLPDQEGCMGTLAFPFVGLQNGGTNGPDGLVLLSPSGDVLEFLSYEGTFTAASGPAAGLVSVDIGVQEGASTPVGHSLQRSGSGARAGDFSFLGEAPNSSDQVNSAVGQSFDGCGAAAAPALGAVGRWQLVIVLLGAACGSVGASLRHRRAAA